MRRGVAAGQAGRRSQAGRRDRGRHAVGPGVGAAQQLRAFTAGAAGLHAFEGDIGVEDLAGARVHVAGPDGAEHRLGVHHPAHRGVAEVQRVEVRVVALLLHDDGVAEADALEGLVPFQDRRAHRLAVGQRHVAVDPEGDGLDRFGDLGCRVLFLEPPAVHPALPRRVLQVAAEVEHGGGEMAQPGVGAAWRHRLPGQRRQRIVQAHEQAACVGQELRWHRLRCPEQPQTGPRSHAGGVEMALRLDHDGFGGTAHRRDDGIAQVQRMTLAQAALQLHGDALQVGQEQAIGFDQHALAFGVRLAGHGYRAEQAVRIGIGHRACLGRAGLGQHLGVARLQPHLVVHAQKFNHLRPTGTVDRVGHQAAQHPGLADATLDLGRQQEGLAQLLGPQFDPDLFVLLPHRERAFDAARVLDHRGEGRRPACGGRWRRRGGAAARRSGRRGGACACRRGPARARRRCGMHGWRTSGRAWRRGASGQQRGGIGCRHDAQGESADGHGMGDDSGFRDHSEPMRRFVQRPARPRRAGPHADPARSLTNSQSIVCR